VTALAARGATEAVGPAEGPDEAFVGQAAVLEGIHKSFGPVRALVDVSLELKRGEIRALVGENGAGKTTLMTILYGMLKPDQGHIGIWGRRVGSGWSPREAMRQGVGMLHQHFSLVPTHTVLENVLLPQLTWGALRPDWKKHRAALGKLCEEYGFQLRLDAPLRTLAVGQQQQVEILKLLYQGTRLLILDEPTSVLTPQQIDSLLNLLAILRRQGHTVVLITHKLPEAMSVADAITVLRGGRVIDTVARDSTTPEALARMMVNRDISGLDLEFESRPSAEGSAGKTVLAVRDLVVGGEGGRPAVDGVSLEVKRGEILGVAGVAGNGQMELAQAIVGLSQPSDGPVVMSGKDITRLDVRGRKNLGLGFIPEDRHEHAMFPEMSVRDNLTLERLEQPPLSRAGLVRTQECRRAAIEAMKEYDVRAMGPGVPTGTLSGGNQQKVVLARVLSGKPKVIVACQPTRGLDFAATRYVRERLWAASEEGVGILLISSELEELLTLSHRIVVMFRGRIVGEFKRGSFDIERIGLLMTGQGRTP